MKGNNIDKPEIQNLVFTRSTCLEVPESENFKS